MLDEYDGPRLFTVCNSDGELHLAYWSDEDDQITRYVVVPTNCNILQSLKSGAMSVFDALNQPHTWICDLTKNGDIAHCKSISFHEIPSENLPERTAMLWPSLEPLVRQLGTTRSKRQ